MGKAKKSAKDFEKEHLLSAIKKDEAEIKKYEKLLKIRKRKNKSQFSDIFAQLDPLTDDEDQGNDNEEEDCQSDEPMETDDGELSEDEESDEVDNSDNEEEVIEMSEEEPLKKKKKTDGKMVEENEDQKKVKRSILSHLNRLCESQMMKCLDGIEEIWNGYPRGDVRDIFIKESVNYMDMSCIELAAFVASLHKRLSKQTNLIAFYMEHLMEKLTSIDRNTWKNEAVLKTVMVICKFIAYITRMEVIDTNLVIDLMEEIISGGCEIPQLKVILEILNVVGFFIKTNNGNRCEEMVANFNRKMESNIKGTGDLSEIRSYSDAVVAKITTAKAKNDVDFQNIVKYRKLMRTWCKKSANADRVALRLLDFRGENRVRWWLVGSGLNPNIVHSKSASKLGSSSDQKEENLTPQQLEWNEMASSLGFTTDGKRCLFRYLMQGKSSTSKEEIESILLKIKMLSRSKEKTLVSESDIAGVIIRCLVLEKEFCQFYVNVLASLIEMERRFRQLVKCAIWDVLAQPKLVESSRINCGQCLGQLIVCSGFPVNCLKKFNFLDDTNANVSFMVAVLSELAEDKWESICSMYNKMATSISGKFVSNLRIFIKKHFLSSEDKFSRQVVSKMKKSIEFLHELRKSLNQ